MSKPTDDLWWGMGWCLIWLGLLGGVALIVWAAGWASGRSTQAICAQQHGKWVTRSFAEDSCQYGGQGK